MQINFNKLYYIVKQKKNKRYKVQIKNYKF